MRCLAVQYYHVHDCESATATMAMYNKHEHMTARPKQVIAVHTRTRDPPDRIHGPIKQQPLPVRPGVLCCLPERLGQYTILPLMAAAQTPVQE